MEYHDLVRDFAERTRHNLRLIEERAAAGDRAYEVTQLINSMLGLLVLPQQHYYERVPRLTIAQLRERGWPEPVLSGDIGEPSDLRELFRYLRNGITHFNLRFREQNGVLSGITIWNHLGGNRDNPKNWQVSLGLDELLGIADRFISLLLEPEST